jgi:transcriptional regulator with XRE-family HTH domain
MSAKRDPVWQRWGAELRRLRELTGRTQSDLGKSALMAKATVSAFERGQRTPRRDHAEALDTALSTGGALLQLWAELHDQTHIPEWFRDVLLLERKAEGISEYEPVIIPGLLQTVDYARAVIRSRRIRESQKKIDELAGARAGRLAALREQRPLLRFVVKHAVLRTVVGNEKIMTEQLDRLCQLAEDGTIRIQVLPDAGVPPGVGLPFRIMTLSPTQSVVYAEHAVGGEVINAAEQVKDMMTLFGELQADALSHADSLEQIHTVRSEIAHV